MEADESAIKRMIRVRRQQKAIYSVETLLRGFTGSPRFDVARFQERRICDSRGGMPFPASRRWNEKDPVLVEQR